MDRMAESARWPLLLVVLVWGRPLPANRKQYAQLIIKPHASAMYVGDGHML